MDKTAIVTGANGFIGSAVVRNLVNHGYEVHALVHKNRENIEGMAHVTIHEANLEKADTFSLPSCEYFFHFAWNGLSGEKRFDEHIQQSNLVMTQCAMDLAIKSGCKRFIGCGSVIEDEALFSIDDPTTYPARGQYYGFIKMLCRYYCKLKSFEKIEYVCGKLTNAYGPGEDSPRLINTVIKNMIYGHECCLSSCTQQYDFIYIEDVANAFRLIAENGANQEVYTVSYGEPRPLREYLLEIADYFEKKELLKFGEIHNYISLPEESFKIDKLKKIGFKPNYCYKLGIKKTIDWYMDLNRKDL